MCSSDLALRPEWDDTGRITGMGADPITEHRVRIAFCGEPDGVRDAVRRIAAFAAAVPS